MSTWWAVATAILFTLALSNVLYGQGDPWTLVMCGGSWLVGYWAAQSGRGTG